MSSPYIPNDTEEIRRLMLERIGINSVEELFKDIPKEVRLNRPLKLPGPCSEAEVVKTVESILKKNKTFKDLKVFVGGNVWPHYVPAAIDEITERSEFLTSYTPYQPEVSQGILQALFEYQSMICELLDMDVANCSMYDWASALGEAARMASRITKRFTFIVPRYIDPARLHALKTYAEPAGIKVVEVKQNIKDGQIDLEDLKSKTSSDTAAIYIENPSYLGFLQSNVDAVAELAHDAGALFVVGVDPTSLGILRPPGDYMADIVVGEGQPLGNYMNFGGPLLGILACKGELRFIRQMPGRIIGMTRTVDGSRRAFCMVLQTREQHIRREKATSNICTNEALCAVRAAVYMALLGPSGFRELGENILRRTYYTIKMLSSLGGLKVPLFDAPHFKSFTVNFDGSGFTVEEVNKRLLEEGIVGGKPLSQVFPELGETALYCVTEMHSLGDIKSLVYSLRRVLRL
ncbi:MAG TPA: aminomethyl-transferring glycine dehydrogenase subunit GcvPA [Candidatus Bathyarchaeota archaeon]|nr:aminomethyl-transferring glycine dehydrogenase subunit GcvPA [Candidatus Bathyarchaeota archaeon]